MDVIVAIEGLEKVEKTLEIMKERGYRMQPVLKKLGVAMVGVVDRNFEAEGRPNKWKPRSPITQGTLAMRAQAGARNTKRFQNAKARGQASILRRASLKAMGNKILSGTGDLKKSITFKANDSYVQVGAPEGLIYARIQQMGGVIRPKSKKALIVPCGGRVLRLKSVTIPARPYLIVPPGDVPILAGIAATAFMEEARRI